jgi:glycosyltransferase involved in cell wall biosynthesis
MRLLAIVPSIYDRNPSQRYRIEQWEPHLRRLGVEITYQPFEDDELNRMLYQAGRLPQKASLIVKAIWRRAAGLRNLKEFDAVYVLREAALLGPPVFERLIARSGVPFIFDFDDAVFERYISPSNGYLSYLKFPGKTKTICRQAAHVMAGNDYLATYARSVNQNVTVVPSTIDTDKYTIEPRPANDPPIIGWTGSYSTVQHLLTLAGTLRRLAKTERFRLRVIGAPETDLAALEGVDVELLTWRSETEVEDLRPFDIGVMPLPDDRWSRGKCALKALQYMALGVPAICSPVGVNSTIIRDGENGMLASTEDEWIEKLTALLRSPELRQRLGRAGRVTVETQYSPNSQAPRIFKIIESVIRRSRKEPATAQPAPSVSSQ